MPSLLRTSCPLIAIGATRLVIVDRRESDEAVRILDVDALPERRGWPNGPHSAGPVWWRRYQGTPTSSTPLATSRWMTSNAVASSDRRPARSIRIGRVASAHARSSSSTCEAVRRPSRWTVHPSGSCATRIPHATPTAQARAAPAPDRTKRTRKCPKDWRSRGERAAGRPQPGAANDRMP